MAFGGGNVIESNYIGTDASGRTAIPNGTGVQLILESSGDYLLGNLISGNAFYGIRVFRSVATVISGNRVGTDITGTLPLGNGRSGIFALASSFDLLIGGGSPNRIAFNGGSGVSIGVDSSDASNDNRISGNSIHDNGRLGIDLGDDGVTANNDCDAGRGPNLLQNFPVLTNAVSFGGSTIVDGALNSVPNSTFQVELFSNTLCDPSGYGEGQTYLGSTFVRTDSSCNANFEVTLPVNVAPGSFLTATATDAAGNTSEFSACRPVTTGESFYTITPCRVADTRNPDGPLGGPALMPGADRSFVVAGQCGIPPDARAVAFNFAVTQPSAPGDLQVLPGGTPPSAPATLYYAAGQTRAKNAIYALGPAGDIGTRVDQAAGTVQLVIDVTGYFR
jgi:parallel beta-helix repeat protein